MKIEEFKLVMDDLQKRRIPVEIKKTVQILLNKKAEKITVLKLKGITEMTDYLVICSGISTRQNRFQTPAPSMAAASNSSVGIA